MKTFADYGLPTPKYAKGDRVYQYHISVTDIPLSCPDCNDTFKVDVVFPTGVKLQADCPRCRNVGYTNPLPRLFKKRHTVEVQALTIGQIRINDGFIDRGPITYMCSETGIDSGSIYYEDLLFPTADEARTAGEIVAAERNAVLDDDPREKHVQFIDTLKWNDAFIESHRSQVWNSAYHLNNVLSGIETIISEAENKSKSSIIEDLESALKFDFPWHQNNHPIFKRLKAAEAVLEFFRENIVDGILVARWPQELIDTWNTAVESSTLKFKEDL